MSEEKKADVPAATEERDFTGEVFLVSQDGQKFKVSTKTAAMSELVKTMLGEGADDEEEEEDEGSWPARGWLGTGGLHCRA